MAFINSVLTQEEQERFRGYGLKNHPKCSNNHKILGTVRRWQGIVTCTVDRERGIYFFDCGINHWDWREFTDDSHYYALVIEDEVPCLAYVALRQYYKDIEKDGYRYLWELRGLDNRCSDRYTDEELLGYIREALCAYGLEGRPEREPAVIKTDF